MKGSIAASCRGACPMCPSPIREVRHPGTGSGPFPAPMCLTPPAKRNVPAAEVGQFSSGATGGAPTTKRCRDSPRLATAGGAGDRIADRRRAAGHAGELLPHRGRHGDRPSAEGAGPACALGDRDQALARAEDRAGLSVVPRAAHRVRLMLQPTSRRSGVHLRRWRRTCICTSETRAESVQQALGNLERVVDAIPQSRRHM
jgi:hypothetical protein